MGRIEPETLYFGDCLDVMEEWDPQQVDLIYLDPPFNSDINYNILFGKNTNGKSSQFLAFADTWEWNEEAVKRVSELKSASAHPAQEVIRGLETILGPSGMLSYLSYMAQRLYQCRRVLKDTGSIYLHCDTTASHYLKMVLDAVFGKSNFKNEIIWSYRRWPSKSRNFQTMHDVILFYVAGGKHTFNVSYEPASESYIKRFKGKTQILDPERKTRKLVLDAPTKGLPQRDVWEVSIIAGSSKERTGYPTQKPLSLLHRIIQASSNEGDLVLDPFCGCGTAIVAAHGLSRQWAGIDISAFAIQRVMRTRFKDQGFDCTVKGIPVDLRSSIELAESNPFAFEAWAVNQVPGLAPNSKQVADGGIDGRGTLLNNIEGIATKNVLAQVKSGKVVMDHARAFLTVCEDADAAAGLFIHMRKNDVSKQMRLLFAKKGPLRVEGSPTQYPKFQFWSLEEFFDHEMAPRLPPMCDPITGKEMRTGIFNPVDNRL